MPRAIVLNTASKSSTTGGTFADTLTANSGDTLTIPNLQTGQGKIMSMWGIDSASVAEVALTDGRVESVHDPQFGIRFNLPATAGGGAGKNYALPMITAPNSYMPVIGVSVSCPAACASCGLAKGPLLSSGRCRTASWTTV